MIAFAEELLNVDREHLDVDPGTRRSSASRIAFVVVAITEMVAHTRSSEV